MLVLGYLVVGGIEIHPASLGQENGKPGVGVIGALPFLLTRQRQRLQIAADVTGGQTQAAQARDREVGKVPTDPRRLARPRERR
jgi:hypothetical protein